jgi:hypothetical protein
MPWVEDYLYVIVGASPVIDRSRRRMELSNEPRMYWVKEAVLPDKGLIVEINFLLERLGYRNF